MKRLIQTLDVDEKIYNIYLAKKANELPTTTVLREGASAHLAFDAKGRRTIYEGSKLGFGLIWLLA